jgi:hypothetical protein
VLYHAVDLTEPFRIVVPLDNALRARILVEYHDSPSAGHLGREITYLAVSRDFYWSHVRTVKPKPSTQAPLRSISIPEDQ